MVDPAPKRNLPAHSAEYVACGEPNHWYGVTCIRPHDHEGQHSGSLMEPHRVWWQPRAVDPEHSADGDA